MSLPHIIKQEVKTYVSKRHRRFLPDRWDWHLHAIRYGTTTSATDWSLVDKSKEPPPFEASGSAYSKREALAAAERILRRQIELEKDEHQEPFVWSEEMSGRWSWFRP